MARIMLDDRRRLRRFAVGVAEPLDLVAVGPGWAEDAGGRAPVALAGAEARLARLDVLGVPVAALAPAEALRMVELLGERPEPALLAFANAHTVNTGQHDPRYLQVLRDFDLVLRDGSGLALAARMAGHRFPANLNGSDFTPDILAVMARRGWSVFVLGGRPGVAEEAARVLQAEIPGLRIAGTHHGLFPVRHEHRVADEVRRSGADVCLVGMGNPLQEVFLARYAEAMGIRLGIGVGAFFDFTCRRVPRAPRWLNRLGVEWVYRLVREPRRMWRRYLVGNPEFLVRCLWRPVAAMPDGERASPS